jgi:hypothetical protein
MRDKRDKGDIAGQSVADVSRIEPERDNRDTSATTETPYEQELFDSVAGVADVAVTNGTAHNGQPVPGRTGAVQPQCPCGRPSPIDRETGLCQWCTVKAGKVRN